MLAWLAPRTAFEESEQEGGLKGSCELTCKEGPGLGDGEVESSCCSGTNQRILLFLFAVAARHCQSRRPIQRPLPILRSNKQTLKALGAQNRRGEKRREREREREEGRNLEAA